MKCKLDTDEFQDVGRVYTVLRYSRRDNSTAVELELRLEDGSTLVKTVATHEIEWIEDED
jgi:hypothetical protein